jgi:hypothetical protein
MILGDHEETKDSFDIQIPSFSQTVCEVNFKSPYLCRYHAHIFPKMFAWKPDAHYIWGFNLGSTKCYMWEYTQCSCRLGNMVSASCIGHLVSKETWPSKPNCQLLSITARQSLLYIAFSATLFLNLQQVFSAVSVNCNYQCQFTWYLHSVDMILAQLIMAWFM